MRLIDADALLEKLKSTNRYFDIKFDIEEAPTIKPETGHWIEGDGFREVYAMEYVCSVCGCEVVNGGNYCKWCGAEMKEGEQE